MTALIADSGLLLRQEDRRPHQAVIAALGLVTACTPTIAVSRTTRRPAPSSGAALGGVVGGLAFGSVGGVVGGALVGGLAGNLVGRALDDQEAPSARPRRPRSAFVAENNVPTTYTVEPTKTSSSSATTAPPTVVAPSRSHRRPAAPTAAPAGRSN